MTNQLLLGFVARQTHLSTINSATPLRIKDMIFTPKSFILSFFIYFLKLFQESRFTIIYLISEEILESSLAWHPECDIIKSNR